MVLQNGEINIIADMEGTTGVKLHNNRQKLRSRFDIIKKLGQGTYGKVQLAINKDTGEEVAIKTIKKSKIETEQDLVRIQREIQIMSSVQHPHIIHIYEVFENREKIVLVMEYASGGELYDYISYKKVLEEIEARRVFRQVAAAVFYCHKNMICHRDLKLENILLDERGCAKIADFGLSNVFDERNFLNTFCGSPLYASPEIVRGIPYYGPEVDCWSLGVLLYTLCYGAMPFDGSNFKKLVRQISEGDYYEPKVPSEASHLIRRMLTVDPAKRASIDDICTDVWVDMGEDTPLWEIAEEMCKQMPVRLDYLLTLTAAAAASSRPPTELPIPPPPPLAQDTESGNSALLENETQVDDDYDKEGAYLEGRDIAGSMSVDHFQDVVEQEKVKQNLKHKLLITSSSSIMLDENSKKKKFEDADVGIVAAEAEGLGSVDLPAQSVQDSSDSKSNNLSIKDAQVENRHGEEQSIGDVAKDNVLDTSIDKAEPLDEGHPGDQPHAESKIDNKDREEVSLSVDVATNLVGGVLSKRETSPIKKRSSVLATKRSSPPNSSANKLNKSVSEVAENQSEAPGGLQSKSTTSSNGSGKSLVRIIKKSTSNVASKDTGKNGIGSGDQSMEKRKLSFPALRPVNEAKKSFEISKSTSAAAEVKSTMGVQLKKVSSVRKAFESSPPTIPEASKNLKSPIKKQTTGDLDAKSKPEVDASETSVSDAKKVQQPIVRQGSVRKFGFPPRASVSPTKTLSSRTSTSQQQQNQHHHQGCVPHEAKIAAEQEAKSKPSTPGTSGTRTSIARKPGVNLTSISAPESPTRRTSTGLTNAPSFTMRRTSAPGNNGSNSSSSSSSSSNNNNNYTKSSVKDTAVRSKSPVKSIKEQKIPKDNFTEIGSNKQEIKSSCQGPFDDPDKSEEKSEPESVTDDALTKKMESVDISSIGKRGSIEIAPLPRPECTETAPQISFVPRNKGQFTLLGVKSEVMFDIGDGTEIVADEMNSKGLDELKEAPDIVNIEQENLTTMSKEVDKKDEDNSKIIRYVATVRRHGSEDANDTSLPERVTLLNIRRSETGMSVVEKEQQDDDDCSLYSNQSLEPEAVSSKTESEMTKTTEEKSIKCGHRQVEDNESSRSTEISNSEQRGYSVYRSKYRSVQKYRSIVEHRKAEDDDEVPVGALGRSTSKSNNDVERSDSFSSAEGSADDLEDVFESLTSESLFTSLLNRTRSLIERIADGDDSPFFRSSLLSRRFLGAASDNLSSNSAAMSLLLNPPTISFRRNPVAGFNIGYNYDPLSSRSSAVRSPPIDQSDLGMRRWRQSRSTTRASASADPDGIKLASSASLSGACNIRLRARASFNSSDYSSGSLSNSKSAEQHRRNNRQSRYETFKSSQDQRDSASMTSSIADSANRRREEARSDIISALLRHRNRSLDARRPHSLYDHGSDEYLGGTKSASPQFHQRGHDPHLDELDRQDVMSASMKASNNAYGTVRRPPNPLYPRYTKSISKEMNTGESTSTENSSNRRADLRRPRSIHEILSANLKDAVNGDGDDNDDATSLSRDYSKSGSKSVSRNGATKREEEEEFEREHRITDDGVGRSVTTTQRQVSRSISQTDDDDNKSRSTSSSVHHVRTSSTLMQSTSRRGAGKKSNCGDDDDLISRQDSGLGGSLYDGGSLASSNQRQGCEPVGSNRHSVIIDNDIESLEKEISRIGLRRHQLQESMNIGAGGDLQSPEGVRNDPIGGEDGAAKTMDGTTTPANSDSADTGSVCSDASGTGTETSTSTVKASSEESVGDRIRRKSFFARFNDTNTRMPRKGRKPSNGSSSSSSSMSSSSATSNLRSDLNRSSSLRHRILDDVDTNSFTASRFHYDSPTDFYGISSRYSPQRWSMHPGSASVDPDFMAAYDSMPGINLSPRRRSSFQNAGVDNLSAASAYLRRPASGSWIDDSYYAADNMQYHPSTGAPSTSFRATSPHGMSRAQSLPEEGSMGDNGGGVNNNNNNNNNGDQRVHRKTSAPSAHGIVPPVTPPGSSVRRPTHLGGLYSTQCDEADEWPNDSWSTRASQRQNSTSGAAREPPPPPGEHRNRFAGSSRASSLMDTLDSPSEVLQKAMDLCDSLRYNT